MKATKSQRFNPFSHGAVNFLLADVRGLGPYHNVFPVTQQHWSQSEVEFVTTIGALLGLIVQTPIGAAIDETQRALIVAALAVLGVGGAIIFAWPSFWPVAIANTLRAVVGDVFGPAAAALTLGLFARNQPARRTGRNSAFDHAGNVAIAPVAAGSVMPFRSTRSSFSSPIFALFAVFHRQRRGGRGPGRFRSTDARNSRTCAGRAAVLSRYQAHAPD